MRSKNSNETYNKLKESDRKSIWPSGTKKFESFMASIMYYIEAEKQNYHHKLLVAYRRKSIAYAFCLL